LGRRPEGRLYAHAAWHAKYLKAGSWHEFPGIVTGLDDLTDVALERTLADPAADDRRYQGRLDCALSTRLDQEGLQFKLHDHRRPAMTASASCILHHQPLMRGCGSREFYG
jgi:hypothetical protein